MRRSDGTITPGEQLVIDVVWANDGADLSSETHLARALVDSRLARRMKRDGLLTVDAGARAHLTELGLGFVRHTPTQQ